jgi:para-aminobenzoate synthetase component 1
MTLVVEELTPAPTTWDVFVRLAHSPHVVFFDSSLPHPKLGRYSFVAADPFEFHASRGMAGGDPFKLLGDRLSRYSEPSVPGLPPFQGGAAGLFGYDLAHHIERLPRPRFDDFQVPDLAIGLYDCVAAFDHVQKRCWLISTGLPESDGGARRQRAEMRLRAMKRWLAQPPISSALRVPEEVVEPLGKHAAAPERAGLLSNFDAKEYLAAVHRAIDYIHAGDCFQVNMAQRLLFRNRDVAVDLYGRLRQRNAATFSGYFDLGDFVIASASPERFLRLKSRYDSAACMVETRPIKGTRPRGATAADDERFRAELLTSAKDRAENVMIVDLLRNDLGRVCRYGSVQVADLCRLESYPFVHHLVSEVQGQLREGLGAIDLLRAAFPGGSVTGAPKIRAMEIIAELEPHARGAYCGCLGYIGFDGSMDTSILIRTFTVGKGWMQFPVGGGIVADSDPQREYQETWHKAAGLLRALEA